MKNLFLHIVLLAGFVCSGFAVSAQPPKPVPIHPVYGVNDTLVVYGTVMADGSIVPTGVLQDAYCYGKMPRWMIEKMKEWTRLRNAVYVCYPYAKAAGKIINEVNSKLAGITDEKERKKIIKEREKEMRKNFTNKITDLSVYQGKVLMKLINRETGNNCFEILKEYKGGFNAVVYQSVAFVFGSNLKQSYEPAGADKDIELIVKDVEKLYRG